MKNQHIIIKYKILKDKIIKMIPEFSKLIEEYGLDGEWYQHLENLSKRLSLREIKTDQDYINEYSKNIISLGFNTNTKKIYKTAILSNHSSTNMANRNNNKENKNEIKENTNNNNILNINNESLGGGQNYSLLSLVSKKNINNNEDNMKKIKDYNNLHNIKIILDRNFDTIFNLRKIGTIYFYVVDLYEKTIYKKDEHSSLIYEPKYKFSFSKKRILGEEQFGKLDKDKKGEDNKYIKAKTLFGKQSKNHLNLPNIGKDSIILIKEDSIIGEDDRIIQRVKTWTSENNSIDIQKHLIKEGGIIFDVNDNIKTDSKNDKISANSDENNINSIKNIRKNIERNTRKKRDQNYNKK